MNDTIQELVPLIEVRRLRPSDFERVVDLDALVTGRRRRGYFAHKLATSLLDSSLEVSLGAEIDASLIGFVLARVWTGEFGLTEPVAVLDTIAVHPAFQHHGVGDALLEQLAANLRGLCVAKLRTEVAWDEIALLRFFHHRGFAPAPRLCLDLELEPR